MAVAVGHAIDAESEEFVLGILRHHAGVADTKKFNSAPRHVGRYQRLHRPVNGMRTGIVAVFQKRSHRVVNDFHHDVAGFVINIHTAVNEGHALAHAASEFQLEITQAVITHAAAKPNHGGFADVGT